MVERLKILMPYKNTGRGSGTLSPKGAGNSTSAGGVDITTGSAAEGNSSAAAPTQAEGTANTTSTATPGKRWVVDKPAQTETKWIATTKYINRHYISVSTTDPNDLVPIEDTKLMRAWREGKISQNKNR